MPKCKITIIKRTLQNDLIDEYIVDEYQGMEKCECFKDNQSFIVDPNLGKAPEGFCDWAWAEIRKDLMLVASGGDIVGMRNKGTVITGCTDWFRQVYFKIERLGE